MCDSLRALLSGNDEALHLLVELSNEHSQVTIYAMQLALDHEVIGLHWPGDFPGFSEWRTTRRTIIAPDLCDHRHAAENARYMRSEGCDEVAGTFERLARASLEADLGDGGAALDRVYEDAQ